MIAHLSKPVTTSGKPPAYFFPVVDDTNTCIAFLWCGPALPGCYDIQLQRRHGGRWCLGRIEFNSRLECWYITHLGKAPLSKAESFPFLGWHDSAQYLYEHWMQEQQKARVAAEA